ncbi:MAG: hypothetical protein WA412_17990 [Candidatus Sulfotelmatobacter sp.]
MDSQAAKYMLERYEGEWVGAGVHLYDLCVNTSTGPQTSAAVINAELMRAEEDCIPEEEFSPCHLPPQR